MTVTVAVADILDTLIVQTSALQEDSNVTNTSYMSEYEGLSRNATNLAYNTRVARLRYFLADVIKQHIFGLALLNI